MARIAGTHWRIGGWLPLAVDGSRATGQVVRFAERLPMAENSIFSVVHAHEPPYEAMMSTVGVGNLSVASYASASMSQAGSISTLTSYPSSSGRAP